MRNRIISAVTAALAIVFCMGAATPAQHGETRIKNIARIAGVEPINLVGYGIVTGLRGTGDKDLTLTRQTMANLMENFNITLNPNDAKSKNAAAVMVTTVVPPFHVKGDRIDVEISSLGDAVSLEGGVLMMTPLLDPNGDLYAIAQGNITLGGYAAGAEGGAGGNSVVRNHTTAGICPGGGTLRQSQSATYCQNGILQFVLHHADFTTADRMATALNKSLGNIAVARNASMVAVQVPDDVLFSGRLASFIAKAESVTVTPDARARVIVNERTGTIVMGGDVQIREAVVAHGNLTVTVKDTLHPSHPTNIILGAPQPGIRTVVTPDTKTTVDEDKAKVMLVPGTTTVRQLADTLNIMGATPRDLISILEALQKAGALQMELVAM